MRDGVTVVASWDSNLTGEVPNDWGYDEVRGGWRISVSNEHEVHLICGAKIKDSELDQWAADNGVSVLVR